MTHSDWDFLVLEACKMQLPESRSHFLIDPSEYDAKINESSAETSILKHLTPTIFARVLCNYMAPFLILTILMLPSSQASAMSFAF
jgi:hypothetical protein